MTDYERTKARQWQNHKENMKDPDYAKAYKEMQRRKKEMEAGEKALKRFELGWDFPPKAKEEPKQKSDAEMRHEELTSLFGNGPFNKK